MFHVAFYRKCITITTISIVWTAILIVALFVEKYSATSPFDLVDFLKACSPLLLLLCVLNTVLPALTLVHYRAIVKENCRVYKLIKSTITTTTK